jgi:two-component system, LytTR family, response regulator
MSSETIKAMIVEDQDAARLALEQLLSRETDVTLVDSATTVREAVESFLLHKPDLVFLDVELPDGTGFDFLERIKPVSNHLSIIITTAFDHYAIKAIKHAAFDYLLKPIDPLDLKLSLEKIRQSRSNLKFQENITQMVSSIQPSKPLKFNSKNGFVMVNPADIMYCEADWNYTNLVLSNSTKILVSLNLASIDRLLDKKNFIRISRSILINSDYVLSGDKKRKLIILKKDNSEHIVKIAASKLKFVMNLICQ